MSEFSILLVGSTPPSFNKVGHTGCRWSWTREKKRWQEMIEMALMAEGVPRGLPEVLVTADLTFPEKRKRDTGNFRTLLEKCAGDALVNGGWLEDDTPDYFEFGAVRFHIGARSTKLTLGIPDDVRMLPKPPAPTERMIEVAPRWRRRIKG